MILCFNPTKTYKKEKTLNTISEIKETKEIKQNETNDNNETSWDELMAFYKEKPEDAEKQLDDPFYDCFKGEDNND